jgi:cytochrome c556
MKRFQPRIALALAVVTSTLAGSAIAQQGPKPEDEIRYRQSVMTVIGRAMGPMGAMAQGKAPFNAAVVEKNSALVDTLLGLPWNAFGPGTDKGMPNKADPKIWTDSAKFKQASEANQKAASALASASKSGNEASFKAAFGDLGKTCKGCHDDFRTKESHN